jgi:hypothetical protein
MREKLAWCALFVGLITGCAAERTVMVNSRGDQLSCETNGAGFFGSISVHGQQEQCIADAEARGYRTKD